MKVHTFEEYPCGCWYERISLGGETLSLRLTTCAFCMQLAWIRLETLDAARNLELDLASPAQADQEAS